MRPSRPLVGVGGGFYTRFALGFVCLTGPSPYFSLILLVLLPSRLRTRMSRNLSPRSLLSERPLGIDYQSKLRHEHTDKHKHKKNELVRFSCDYAYAYVDPVFTCLHMCLCLCLCPSELENQAQEICCYLNRVQCLQLADNENRQYADTVPSVSKAR